jgi:hypothetical protein
VRRLDYVNEYLNGVSDGYDPEDLEILLAETKRRFEREKSLAVSRGNPYRKNIKNAKSLTDDCRRLTEAIGFVNDEILTGKGEYYLKASDEDRKTLLCTAYSSYYPHLGVFVSSLFQNGTFVLPMRNKPPFRPMIKSYGIDTHQVGFDIIRDIATDIGLVNWFTKGKTTERRQHVYLVCHQVSLGNNTRYKVRHQDAEILLVPNEIPLSKFRDTLYEKYMLLVNGVPGFPVFYSEIREVVCMDLKISDLLFDQYTEILIEDDDVYNVIWSQGILPKQQDSASMLKSLPPKNIDGNYVIFLKIVRYR